MGVVNRRYPNHFEIYKMEKVGGGVAGGGVETKVIKLEGRGSLQKGNVRNQNKADTYKWLLCFNLNDMNSVPNRPAAIEIDNTCTVKVTDVIGVVHEDLLFEQFHSDMGSDVYFGEINTNNE